MEKASVFTSQSTEQEQASNAPQLTRFIEHMRIVSQAYAKLAHLLEDSASEAQFVSGVSAANNTKQTSHEGDPTRQWVTVDAI